ncbi:hypothetical protein P8452_40349 [Trifolium repens]|nr:hypothetical protein P8452_40349 [Trifolium repens]
MGIAKSNPSYMQILNKHASNSLDVLHSLSVVTKYAIFRCCLFPFIAQFHHGGATKNAVCTLVFPSPPQICFPSPATNLCPVSVNQIKSMPKTLRRRSAHFQTWDWCLLVVLRILLKLVGNKKTHKYQPQYSTKFENEVPSDLY